MNKFAFGTYLWSQSHFDVQTKTVQWKCIVRSWTQSHADILKEVR